MYRGKGGNRTPAVLAAWVTLYFLRALKAVVLWPLVRVRKYSDRDEIGIDFGYLPLLVQVWLH